MIEFLSSSIICVSCRQRLLDNWQSVDFGLHSQKYVIIKKDKRKKEKNIAF